MLFKRYFWGNTVSKQRMAFSGPWPPQALNSHLVHKIEEEGITLTFPFGFPASVLHSRKSSVNSGDFIWKVRDESVKTLQGFP